MDLAYHYNVYTRWTKVIIGYTVTNCTILYHTYHLLYYTGHIQINNYSTKKVEKNKQTSKY